MALSCVIYLVLLCFNKADQNPGPNQHVQSNEDNISGDSTCMLQTSITKHQNTPQPMLQTPYKVRDMPTDDDWIDASFITTETTEEMESDDEILNASFAETANDAEVHPLNQRLMELNDARENVVMQMRSNQMEEKWRVPRIPKTPLDGIKKPLKWLMAAKKGFGKGMGVFNHLSHETFKWAGTAHGSRIILYLGLRKTGLSSHWAGYYKGYYKGRPTCPETWDPVTWNKYAIKAEKTFQKCNYGLWYWDICPKNYDSTMTSEFHPDHISITPKPDFIDYGEDHGKTRYAFAYGNSQPIVRITTKTGDALFIDFIEVANKLDNLNKVVCKPSSVSFTKGAPGGKGWCMSTEVDDYKGDWEDYVGNANCWKTLIIDTSKDTDVKGIKR